MADKDYTQHFQEFLKQVKGLCDNFLSQLAQPEPNSPVVEKVAKRKAKKIRDPLAPKMPKSAFIFYFQDKKERFKTQYPSILFKRIKELQFSEITKLISQEWNDLSTEKKQSYLDSAEIDRKRYQDEQILYGPKSSTKKGKEIAKKDKIVQKEELSIEMDSFNANLDE